ncbi:heavy metal translocatin [Wallemia mellicola]|uniref:P-type Cu(+) transporter n=1 Tax=Wallemia mellicola TaxID=1708541 RepID=A0AB38MR51_9BASI|nr:heavy metal translocatin [Wallemia mellicola]TIC61588.1 heavy metal translocatin [Wallemia mellicola]
MASIEEEKCTLKVEGMTCSSCVQSIESYIGKLQGVNSIQVALLSEKATITYLKDYWDPEKLANEIDEMGFEASVLTDLNSSSIIDISIFGMTCSSCTSSIETALSNLEGVINADISLPLEYARIQFNPDIVGVRDIVELIQETGFDCMIRDDRNDSQLKSLSRIKEVNQWKSALKYSAYFSIPVFIIGMVLPMIPSVEPIIFYNLWRGITIGDLSCLLLTLPVQFGVGKLFYKPAYKSLIHRSATMDVLVVFGTTAAFIYSTGVMISSIFTWSNNSIIPQTFFDTSTMLITFVTLGRYLENLAKGKTSSALSDLLQLAPNSATIYLHYDEDHSNDLQFEEKQISTDLLQKGDYIKLVPGERLPADGYVVKGSSSIDESMITGEPIPIVKEKGDTVTAGTMNNNGTIDVCVTRSGTDTALSQIVKLVEDAQTSKAPIQAFADKIAGYFVPVVISLGLITFITWLILSYLIIPQSSLPHIFNQPGMSNFAVCLKLCISTIVVACPCALGLSTPTAVMVGTGVGAQNGILIKGGQALEQASKIKRVIFDKTGTITKGDVNIAAIEWNEESFSDNVHSLGFTKDDVMRIVALVESKSEHPLGQAITNHFNDYDLTSKNTEIVLKDWVSHTGKGVEAQVSLTFPQYSSNQLIYKIQIGNNSITSNDIKEPNIFEQFKNINSIKGFTIVYVTIESEPIMVIALGDEIKSNVMETVNCLMNNSIESYLMTGDQMSTALSIAQKAIIPKDRVFAGVSPKGKRERVIEMMKDNDGTVAMVGDGINDSPALAAASVGIALASGSSIAIEAADIVLMRQGEIEDVFSSIQLSKAIMKKIKMNFLWACAYNIVFIPLAMGMLLPWNIHLHPMMAGLAMACSSVSVVINSLTLKFWTRPSLQDRRSNTVTLFDKVFKLWDAISARQMNIQKDGYQSVPIEMSRA